MLTDNELRPYLEAAMGPAARAVAATMIAGERTLEISSERRVKLIQEAGSDAITRACFLTESLTIRAGIRETKQLWEEFTNAVIAVAVMRRLTGDLDDDERSETP